MAETATDALFEDDLDPIAIGLSGAWGSGKTSVLELIQAEIASRSETGDETVLVVSTQPWRYDPTIGPKESLIGEVLGALNTQFAAEDPAAKTVVDGLKKLARKVNWSKAVKMTARTAITMQLPTLDDVFGLVSDDPESFETEKGMAGFREEFAALLKDPALSHIARVVVLVDDLDRCLPETVVETLEAIRLFLSVEGMSFVIAADEDRVAEAIAQKFGTPAGEPEEETPARLYLHKIVQTTIPLPALSRFDTEAFLFLLLAQRDAEFDHLLAECNRLRLETGSLDGLEVAEGSALAEHLVTAARLTPILYEKFRGNPRRIKRFLNDLNVRQSIAARRGFELKADEIAKLMVLERILTDDFHTVLDWLATGQLRDQLDALDIAANGAPPAKPAEQESAEPVEAPASKKRPAKADSALAAVPTLPAPAAADESSFTDTLRRWAKLPPALDATTISGYLYLAASFAKIEVIDTGLPERLRDVAAALLSSLKMDRAGVDDQSLAALPEADARTLVAYLGKRLRDQPGLQNFAVESLLRLGAQQSSILLDVVAALRGLPAGDVQAATIIKLRTLDAGTFGPVIATWKQGATESSIVGAIGVVEKAWGNGN
ncbi:KAP family NTPase [Agromyces endophyticus]|uniref:KAP family P-loop NTPase fold protein n=1 Tax=Agromyces sp. H17E-10 TaxID=2932244 RepID=UPI001FD07736|nr:P-loop NTPase fold protein [Agromyces sp. H17E-10]UOQ89477.1 KAP family NTPase [Agromyces sp. H17E-10]